MLIPVQTHVHRDECDLTLITGTHIDTLVGIPLTRDGSQYKIDSIPYYDRTIHLWDVVESRSSAFGGHPLITEVVSPSGYKTLRITFPAWAQPIDIEAVWKVHPIHKAWSQLGLIGERIWENDRVVGAVLAVPPSYNLAKIDLLKIRHADLCIELV